MKLSTVLIMTTALVLGGFAFPAQAQLPAGCQIGGNSLHTYALFGGGFVSINKVPSGFALTSTADSCAVASNNKAGDGDNNQGMNGAALPMYNTCLAFNFDPTGTGAVGLAFNAPAAHHTGTIVVTDSLGLIGIQATAGTDGPAAAPATLAANGGTSAYSGITAVDCTGNGGVSDDPNTDPADCGSGLAGVGNPSVTPTIVANVVGISNCGAPADGNKWVFLSVGAYWDTTATPYTLTIDAPLNDCGLDPANGDTTPDGAPDCAVTWAGKAPWLASGLPGVNNVPTPSGPVGFSVPVAGTITG